MLRKFLTVMFVALLGLWGFGGIAGAVSKSAYPATDTPGVGLSGDGILTDADGNPLFDVNGYPIVAVGGTFTYRVGGFASGETIDFSIDPVSAPAGLRSTLGLSKLTPPAPASVQADAGGTLTAPITISEKGIFKITATGRTSGISKSITVNVGGTPAGTSGGTSAGGLASTGASIAGPLAIGFVALFAGLALLFFGTRGVRRRRNSHAA